MAKTSYFKVEINLMNVFTIQLSHLTVTVMLIRQALFATKLIYWYCGFIMIRENLINFHGLS